MSSKLSVRAEFRRSMGIAVNRVVNSVLRPTGRKATQPATRRSYLIEPLESRQYLTAVTLTGPGVSGAVFSAYLNTSTSNVDFYLNGSPGNGTPIQSVAANSLTSVVVVDTQAGATDRLNVYASGTAFTVDGSATSELTLDVEQGSVTLAATQSLGNVEVGSEATLNLTGNVTLGGLTVDGTATHSSGTLTASILNVDNSYTDAGGTTASGITINNVGTFTATSAVALAGTTGTFNDGGNFIENVPAGGTNTIGMSFNNDNMSFDLLSGTVKLLSDFDTYSSLSIAGTNGTLELGTYSDIGNATVQTGGNLVVDGTFWVGNHYASGATYTMSGGTLSANDLYIGSFGGGTFTQTGGAVYSATNVQFGLVTTGAVYNMSGGSFFCPQDFFDGCYGGSGTLNISGGNFSGGGILIGQNGSGTSVMNLSGGTVSMLVVSAGGGGGAGTLNLSGTGVLNCSNYESYGNDGTGSVVQTGGTNNVTTLYVGLSSGGASTSTVAAYSLSGGTLNATTEFVGFDQLANGDGSQSTISSTFNQSGGTNAVTNLALATHLNAGGTYNLTGGTLNDYQITDGDLYAGSAVATFNQSAGQSNFTESVMVGYQATGVLNLTGGTMSLAGTFYDGYDTNGTVNVSGGSLAVNRNLYVTGDGNDGDDPAGAGTFTLSGSGTTVNVANVFLGYSGPATFNLNGGTATTGYFVVDGPSGSIGTLNSNGGSLDDSQLINVLKPSAGGASVVDEGSPYTLNLSATTNVGDNAITAWNIAWGDSTANTSLSGSPPPSSATHTFAAGGHTYSINATASGGGKSYPSPVQSVLVNDLPANISPVSSLSVNAGSLLSFSTNWTDAGSGETHSATISWGDGSFSPATNPSTPGSVSLTQSGNAGNVSASHVFEQHGTYTATLTITDSGGAVAQIPIYINVAYVAPTLKIVPPLYPVYANQPFTLQLHDYGPEPTGVTNWVVQWGDGTSTTLSSANQNNQPSSSTPTEAEWDVPHTYASTGNYTVTATATDSSGTLPAVTAPLAVTAPAPLVTIGGPATATRYSPYTLNLSAAYPASDAAPSTISSWTIQWGDGATQTFTGNPTTATHLYTDAQGPFSITATATDANGTYTAKSLAIDNSFGTLGNGTVDVDAGSSTDSAYATAIDSQGRIVVAGISGTTVMRFLPNGTLDPNFGTGGKVSITGMDWAYGVAIGPNDSVYVGGGYGFDVAKLTSAGVLDTTFGTGGKTTNVLNPSYYDAYDLTVQPDGKILLAGNGSYDFAFARFNPNGTLDTTFGNGGTLVSDIGSPADHAFAVTTQVDGKILAAGYYKMANGNYEMAVARYSSFGVLDPSFGTGGVALTPVGSYDAEALALAVQPNGDIVLAGSAFSTGTSTTARDFALVRYTAAGVLDSTFGTAGIVTTNFGYGDDQAYAIKVLPGGELLVAGHATGVDGKDFGLARYTSAGLLDPTFGVNGLITTKFSPSTTDAAEAMAFDPNGNLFVVGAANGDFGVAKYERTNSITVSFKQPLISQLLVSADTEVGAAVTVSASVLPPNENSVDILTYSWSLIDPTDSSQPTIISTSSPSITFTPTDAGSWSVTLTVSDVNTSGVANATTTFSVVTPQPLAVTGPTLIPVDGTANYLATDLSASSFTWTAKSSGGATILTESGATFAFTPNNSGNYTITATAIDGETQSVQLTATPVAPTVSIAGPSSGFIGNSLTFSSTVNGSAEQSQFYNYDWSVADSQGVIQSVTQSGDPAAYPTTNSTYTVSGTLDQGAYEVQLLIKSGINVVASASFNFVVLDKPLSPIVPQTTPPTYESADFDWGSVPLAGLNDVSRLVPEAVTQESDGKYVIAGHMSNEDSFETPSSFIARFNQDLTLDTSFGPSHTGIVVAQLDSTESSVTGYTDILAIAMSSNGQDVFVTGSVQNENALGNPGPTLMVGEYTTQAVVRGGQIVLPGTFDPAFNGGQPFVERGNTTVSVGTALYVSPADNALYVGGISETPFSTNGRPDANTPDGDDFLLLKFDTSTNQLDTSFGTSGVAQQANMSGYPTLAPFNTSSTPVGDFDQIADSVTKIEVVGNEILLGGYFNRPSSSSGADIGFAMAEYTSAGTLNTSFGSGGTVFTSSSGFLSGATGETLLSAMTILPDGDILTAGIAATEPQAHSGFAHIVTAEYTPSGDLDLSYGGGSGIENLQSLVDAPELPTTPLGGDDGYDQSDNFHLGEIPDNASMVFQPDGKLVVSVYTDDNDSVGYDDHSDPTAWKIERISTSGALDTAFGDNGTGVETVPVPSFPNGSVWSFYPAQRSTAITLTSQGGVVFIGTMFGYPNYYTSTGGEEIPMIVQYRDQPAPSVSGVSAVSTTPTTVDLLWENAGYGQSGFEILRTDLASNSDTVVGTVGPTQESFIDDSVNPDASYSYEIIPIYNAYGVNSVGEVPAPAVVHTLPNIDGYQIQQSIEVPTDGSNSVQSFTFTANNTYLIVVSGQIQITDTVSGDAVHWYATAGAKSSGSSLDGSPFGVQIADGPTEAPFVPDWGMQNSADGHTYVLAYVGDGQKLTFNYESALYPGGQQTPFLVEIYASPRAAVAPPTPPTTPSGAPALSVTVSGGDTGATPAILSADTSVTVLVTPVDSTPVPWTLELLSPTNEVVYTDSGTATLVNGSGTPETAEIIDPSTLADGIYTLRLITMAASPVVNNEIEMQVAIEKPVALIGAPAPSTLGIRPVIDTNTPISVLAAAPDGAATPWTLYLDDEDSGARYLLANGGESIGNLPDTTVDVATIDPAIYPNGHYTLDLRTALGNGQTPTVYDRPIAIWTATKAGNLTLPITDAAVATTAGTIGIQRSYDSSAVGLPSDGIPSFGPGWTFNLLDTKLSTTAQQDTFDPTQSTPAFRAGDLVSLTAPDGSLHVFEFDPVPLATSEAFAGNVTGMLYSPRFIALDGSGATLTLPIMATHQITLAYDPADNEYLCVDLAGTSSIVWNNDDSYSNDFDIAADIAFNPARSLFGNQYQLTLANGTSYILNATTGEVTSSTDQNGNSVTYQYNDDHTKVDATDGSKRLVFTINLDGTQITSINIPGENSISYSYVNGNVSAVTNQSGQTTRYSYRPGNGPQPLTSIINSDGETLLQAAYGGVTAQLISLTNASGKTVPISVQTLGPGEVVESVADAAGDISENVYDESLGNLLRQIKYVDNAAGSVTDYFVSTTSFTYVTDNVGYMSAFEPSGVLVLQSVQTFATFDVPEEDAEGADQSALRFSQTPSSDDWTRQVIFDTSNRPEDTANGQILSSSQRLTDEDSLITTLYSDYVVVNEAVQTVKPQLTTVELQTPDPVSATGYDNVVQSTTYVGYDSSGNEIYSVTPVGRANVPGGGEPSTLVGGFAEYLYVNLVGVNGGSLATLVWNSALGGYRWTYSWTTPTSGTATMMLLDTSLSAGRTTPVLGDTWTLSISDTGNNGFAGSWAGQAFDGSVLGLSTLVTDFFSKAIFTDNSSTTPRDASVFGVTGSVPGWIATGTQNILTQPGGTAPAGLVTSSQDVAVIITPDGSVQINTPVFWSTTTTNTYYSSEDYAYNSSDNAWEPTKLGASYGQLETSIDAAGQETFYAYDASGRTVLQYVFKSWTDSNNNPVYGWVGTTSVYDSSGRLTDTYSATYAVSDYTPGQSIPDLPVTTGGPAGIQVDTNTADNNHVTVYQAPLRTQHIAYNSLGQKADTVDQYGGTTSYTYDANGNTIETLNADGTETLTVYDALNRAIWSTNSFDPNNLATAITTRTVYNQLGQVIETQQYAGQLITKSTVTLGSATLPTTSVATVDGTPNGEPAAGTLLSSSFTYYDAAGNAIETIGANGLRTGTIYDPDGSVEYSGPLNASAPDGGREVTTYAGVSSHAFRKSDFVVDSSTGYTQTLSNQYEASNGLFYSETIDQLGHITKTYTDTRGRTVRTVYDDGSFTETLYSVGSIPVTTDQENEQLPTPTSWVNLQGGQTETVNIAQRKASDPIVATEDVYDADGRLIDVYQPAVVDGDSTNLQLVNPHWHYGYDSAGNEISQTSPTGHDVNGNVTSSGNTTTFEFDQNGNQVRQILPGGESESWTYNVYNQVSTFTDFNGNVATYTYIPSGTEAGLLHQVVYAGANNSVATQTVTYTYDDLNRQHTVTDASGTTTSTYDLEGNLIESNTPEGDIHYVFNLATGDHTETYTTYTDVVYGYDSQNRLTTVTVDKLNGTTLTTPLVTTYTYDAAGNKKTETLPDGEVSTYGYDDLNRLTNLSEVQGSTTLFSQTYVLNDDGTRASSHEVQLQPDNSTVTVDRAWAYDALQRLTGEVVTSTASNESYSNAFSYDLDNNRSKSVHVGPGAGANETITYKYNGDDELMSQSSSLNGTTINTYDSNGSLTTSTTGGVTTTYTYDSRNKMVGYASGTNTATYVYDDDGDRIAEIASGVTTLYLTDTQNPTGYDQPLEAKNSPNPTPSTTYLLGDHIFAQSNASSVVSYLLADGHGSTQQLTTAFGVVAATYRYDAFGDALNFNLATAGTVILFGGDAIFDQVSGLYLNGDGIRARVNFDFIQRDTYAGDIDSPITLVKYLYSGANTPNKYDPSGQVLLDLGLSSLWGAYLEAGYNAAVVEEGGAIGGAAAEETSLYEGAEEAELSADEIGTNGGLETAEGDATGGGVEPNDVGAQAEADVSSKTGIPENDASAVPQERIPSATGKAQYRVPDYPPSKTFPDIWETKGGTSDLYGSSQFKDELAFAETRPGGKLVIFTNRPVPETGWLYDMVEAGRIVIRALP